MIVIVVTTYFPRDGDVGQKRLIAQTLPAIRSWREKLHCDGVWGTIYEDILLHLADDGSPNPYIDEIADVWGEDFTTSSQDRCGVGASLNAGIRAAGDAGADFVLYAVDDWMVLQEFDLTPWVKLLSEHEDIGAVRLAHPHPDLTGQIKHFSSPKDQPLADGTWAMRLDRHHFALSMRPTLFHMRFFDTYGPWKENCSANECEQDYSLRVRLVNVQMEITTRSLMLTKLR